MLTLLEASCFYKDCIPQENRFCLLPTRFLICNLFDNFYASNTSWHCCGILGRSGVLVNHLGIYQTIFPSLSVETVADALHQKNNVQFAGLVWRQHTHLLPFSKMKYILEIMRKFDLEHLHVMVVYGSFDLCLYYFDRSDYLKWFEYKYGSLCS